MAGLRTAKDGADVNKVGGVTFILAGALYLVNIGLFIVFNPPSSGAAFLKFANDQATLLQSVFTVFLVIDTTLVVALTALYRATRASGPYFLFGYVLALAGLTFDMVNTVSTFSLINLGRAFATAAGDSQRTVYAALAQQLVPPSVGDMFFTTIFSIAILAIGIGATKAISKSVGYIGVIAGILGIIGGLLGLLPLSIAWPVWFIVTGYKLYGLSSSNPDRP